MSAEGARIPVLILKEGAGRTRGREAQMNNILAAKLVGEVVKSSLGPRGMDKMLVDTLGDVTVTADGATILKEMEVQHPAAKIMVEISKAQDKETGDGTTSVVVLASELLSKAEELIEGNVHPTVILEGFMAATEKALKVLNKIGIKVDPTDKDVLRRVAMTSMASKIVTEESPHLADVAIEAVLQAAEKVKEGYKVDLDDIKVEKKAGESLLDTKIIQGIALDKEVVHPGMPKRIVNAKIALVNSAMEVKKTEFDARIRIDRPEQISAYLDQERTLLKEMVDRVKATKTDVLLCQKGIDDVAQHLLAKEGILAVRRVKKSDMEKLERATGGRIVNRPEDLSPDTLGFAGLVEERRVGEDKWVFVEGCKNPKSVTILIRGGTEKIVDEAERSIHDSMSVVKDVLEKPKIVAGGGASEMELAMEVRRWAAGLKGRKQLAAMRFADALEVIPRALAENSGLDPIDMLTDLKASHEKGERWAGINIFEGRVGDMSKTNVFEPTLVKEQMIKSAAEAATLILRVDDVITKGKAPPTPPTPPPGMPGGMPPGGMPPY
ncbi:MAG: thermosome subunit beta [Candidatus Geothermarchaeales archaeon]